MRIGVADHFVVLMILLTTISAVCVGKVKCGKAKYPALVTPLVQFYGKVVVFVCAAATD